MSWRALTRIFRGTRTILSSAPQPAEGGKCGRINSVSSIPIMAKSPVESSKMSGHPLPPADVAPFACGSGPRRRAIMARHINAFIWHVNWIFRVSDGAVSEFNDRAAVCKEVVRLLTEARKAKGLSMNQLAKKAGLTQPAISILEASQPNPKLDTLLRLSEALEIDLPRVLQKAMKR